MADEKKLRTESLGSYTFARSGRSTVSDSMGMREMQRRAFEHRDAQYLLIKAPPACGKSRALMYVALDKVLHQGLEKVIVAVPQLAIGSSFNDTDLMKGGFFANWHVAPRYNLCRQGSDESKAKVVEDFLHDPNEHYLLCAHPTLVFAYDRIKDKSLFNKALVAIDEFHHVSEDEGNRLGGVVHDLMSRTGAHIVAMTGSYFRGDSVPVLDPEDERRFTQVVYTYYEQLNGYKYLKSLSIDYAFYEGKYYNAIGRVLDTHRKTIVHIPSVNSHESTGNKFNEVGKILETIGEIVTQDGDTGFYKVKTPDGRLLTVADLVTDDERRPLTQTALRDPAKLDTVDIIVALNMAKEGFDWPQCEHALTVGYRASLTEMVQIIGRCTRDYPGKEHAVFTNLLAMPSALLNDVTDAVNSLLKAITLSLLMEQVLAPNVHFRRRSEAGSSKEKFNPEDIVIHVDDNAFVDPASWDVVEHETSNIVEKLMTSSDTIKAALASGGQDVNETLARDDVVRIIEDNYPAVPQQDAEAIAKAVVSSMILKAIHPVQKPAEPDATDTPSQPGGPSLVLDGDEPGEQADLPIPDPGNPGVTPESQPDRPVIEVDEDNTAVLKFKDKLINVDDLDFNLIESINPFENAYRFLSRSIEPSLLGTIRDEIESKRSKVTEKEALMLWSYVKDFVRENGRDPSLQSSSDFERRLAQVLAYVRQKKREAMAAKAAASGAKP